MLILLLLIIPLLIIVGLVTSKKGKKVNDAVSSDGVNSSRNRLLLEAAQKRLAANPKDIEALKTLINVNYEEENYTESARQAATLMALVQSGAVASIDLYDIRVIYGLSCLRIKKYDDAFDALSGAFAIKKDMNSDLLTGLGECEYHRKHYERSSHFLQLVVKAFPENTPARKYLGMDYYRLKKYDEAAAMLRQVLSTESGDKELVFALANSYNEINQLDKALKLFTHLRSDPTYGPSAALFAGSINIKQQNYDEAINDFEIGLKHGNMRTELMLELKYRLATTYLKKEDIPKALDLLTQIKAVNPSFKNVAQEITRYSELISNKNFNIYCNATTPEFISLCRKCLPYIFPKAKIKISNVISDRSDYLDIITEVKTSKMNDSIFFRFYRTAGTLDEVHLRDLYAKIKSNHIGRGYCISPGSFTPQARNFVEARLIDLMDKEDLIKVLSRVK